MVLYSATACSDTHSSAAGPRCAPPAEPCSHCCSSTLTLHRTGQPLPDHLQQSHTGRQAPPVAWPEQAVGCSLPAGGWQAAPGCAHGPSARPCAPVSRPPGCSARKFARAPLPTGSLQPEQTLQPDVSCSAITLIHVPAVVHKILAIVQHVNHPLKNLTLSKCFSPFL